MTQVAAALAAYVAAEGLESPGEPGASMTLDAVLAGALYNKKEPEVAGSSAGRPEVLRRLLSKLSQHHRVVRMMPGEPPAEVVKKGAVMPISIVAEDRHAGRKFITRCVGVEAFAIDPDALAAECQREFRTSCSVAAVPGKGDTGKEVSIQGNMLAELAAFLATAYGVPPQFIDAQSKMK